MQKKLENTMQTPEKVIENTVVEQVYNFPNHGIVIYAVSLEEAQEKLLILINKK
jgi:hypothetical protein